VNKLTEMNEVEEGDGFNHVSGSKYFMVKLLFVLVGTRDAR